MLRGCPDNDLSKLALNELYKYKVDTSDCIFGGERMGLYFVESGNYVRASQVIYDRSNSAFSTINEDEINWDAVLADSTYFIGRELAPEFLLMLH
jgi:2-dehydro-3-deoxygluconokinase